ncbi:MAG: sulfite exporter TauE/SafE family protein [Proteobacteria bacterium]|nr:sulfite exporter TauE/SafE family protein [Pseudomonadota bacterium]MBU1648709.1 sulfite exporter TauE/SafE family protein [Pseudomonadota bacterium]
MLIQFCISLIFLLAGFVQGMTGFGSALVAMPLLSLCIDVKSAVPLCTLNSVVITTFLALKLKKHLDGEKIFPLCIAAIPGMFVGVTLLKKVSSENLSIGLGVLLVMYACYNLLIKIRQRKLHPVWSYLAGFSSGAIGAAFSAGGPPTIIYATLNDWDKDEIKATLSGFFLFNSYLNATAHAVSGLTTVSVLSSFFYSAPFVLLGTVLGSFCYGRIDRSIYLKVIFAFLILMGTMMIVTAW